MAEEIVRHETGENVVMNCAVRSDRNHSYLVAGQESHCQLYNVNIKIDGYEENGRIETLKPLLSRKNSASTHDEHILRNRRVLHDATNRRSSNIENTLQNNNINHDNQQHQHRRIRFEIKADDLTQTDFSNDGPLQRVVRISLNCKLMATGGTDCHVRIWKFPNMMKLYDFDAHTKEVDDLDFSSDSKRLVSIAKDGLAIVWNVENGEEHTRLKWTQSNNVKYLFKRCRFGIHEEKRGQQRLFTIANPLGKVGKQVNALFFLIQIHACCESN